MKNYLIISLLILSVGFCQRLSEVIETYENGNIKSITYHKKTRDGIEKIKYEEYWGNGKNKLRGNYKDGIRDGLWTFWDYHDGKEYKGNEGEVIDIDEIPINFNGTLFWWDTDRKGDGKEYIENHFTIKDGKLNGLMTEWDKNGYKRFESTYKDWKEGVVGREWDYYRNGQKRSETTYKDGELISSECWDRNGIKLEECY